MMEHTFNLSTGRLRQKNQEIEDNLYKRGVQDHLSLYYIARCCLTIDKASQKKCIPLEGDLMGYI